MSIYPKHVTKGENVIIHLRFENSSKKFENIKYQLIIKNPQNKEVYKQSDRIILGSNPYLYETYFSIKIENDFLCGKYSVNFSLTCRGIKIESKTKDWDFFFVEQVECCRNSKNIVLENKSEEVTKCTLYDEENNTLELELENFEKRTVDKKYIYIQYGNNKVFYIKELGQSYYLKNPDIKIDEKNVINVANNEKYDLSEQELEQFKKMPAILKKEEKLQKLYDLDLIIDYK